MNLRFRPAKVILGLCAVILFLAATSCAAPEKTPRESPQKSPQKDPDKLFADGLRLFTRGRITEAIALLSRGEKMRPRDPRFPFALGECYLESGKEFAADPDSGGDPAAAFYDAAQLFGRTLSLDPNHERAELLLARALYLQGNLDGALRHIEAHLARRPDDVEALVLAGRILVSARAASGGKAGGESKKKAEEYLSRALDRDPCSAEAWMLLGDLRLGAGDPSGALASYESGIARCPADRNLNQRLASCFNKNGVLPPEAAIRFYRSLLEKGRKTPEGEGMLRWFLGVWYDALGMEAYREKDYPRAAAAYKESASCYAACGRIHPPFAEDARRRGAQALANAGWSRYHEGRYDLAEAAFERALCLDPGLGNAALGIDYLGMAIVEREGPRKARIFFRRSAVANPWNAKWWNNYAFFCRETGQYEEAFNAYDKAVSLSPDDTRYINDAGMILMYYLKRQPKKAEELFRRAWRTGEEKSKDPFLSAKEKKYHFDACCDAMLNLGRLLLIKKQTKEAEPVIRSLAEKAPERADVKQLLSALKLAKEGKPFSFPE